MLIQLEIFQVPSKVVEEFEYIIHCYLEFCQKERMSKLKKLRSSQANLPIAAKRSEIVDLVAKNKILLIAGDTGCGKSTQVGGWNHASSDFNI